MDKKLIKRISAKTGISVVEIANIFVTASAIIKQNLTIGESCMVPYLGRFTIKEMGRRRMKIMDFKTKEQKVVRIQPKNKVKFIINDSIKAIAKTKFMPKSQTETIPKQKRGVPIVFDF